MPFWVLVQEVKRSPSLPSDRGGVGQGAEPEKEEWIGREKEEGKLQEEALEGKASLTLQKENSSLMLPEEVEEEVLRRRKSA